MADNVVGISLEAKLDAFRQQMSQIPDITSDQAKAMASELNKSIKAAEVASKKAGDAAKKAAAKIEDTEDALRDAGNAAKNFGDAAGKAGGNASKLGGILDLIVPGAGDLANTFADLADAGEVAAETAAGFGVSLRSVLMVAGPVAIAIGAITLAWSLYNAEVEEEAQQQEEARKAGKEHLDLVTQLTKDAEAAERKYAVALGGTTAIEAARTDIAESQAQKFADNIKAQTDELGKLQLREAEIREAEKEGSYRFGYESVANQKRIEELGRSISDIKAPIERETGALLDAEEAARLKADADAHVADRLAKKAEALAKAQEKHKEEEEAVQRATAAALAYVDALHAIEGVGKAAERSQMDAYERLYDNAEQQIAKVEDAKREAVNQAVKSGADGALAEAAAETKAAVSREAVWDAYYSDLDVLRKKDSDAASKTSKAKVDAEKAALHQLYTDGAAMAADAAGRMADSFGNAYEALQENVTDLMDWQAQADEYLTDSQKRQLKKRVKEQKNAARAAFEAQKIAAMATAAINTALAVSSALGSAPWPYNLIPAGFALAAGIAEEAAIASQQPAFHKGGPLDLAPDEMSITARDNEYMLNPTGRSMIGDEELGKANAGMRSSSTPSVYAVSVYKHTRQVDRWKSDGLLQGDPISKAIQEGKLVGHRSR